MIAHTVFAIVSLLPCFLCLPQICPLVFCLTTVGQLCRGRHHTGKASACPLLSLSSVNGILSQTQDLVLRTGLFCLSCIYKKEMKKIRLCLYVSNSRKVLCLWNFECS